MLSPNPLSRILTLGNLPCNDDELGRSLMPTLRQMNEKDIAAVLQIQAENYVSSMVETETIVRCRLRDFPETAWVAEDAHTVCGYLVAYPSRVGHVTSLASGFETVDDADCLYLHDLAIAKRAKGQGMGRSLVQGAWDDALARGLRCSTLVSVQDSQRFWHALGYVVSDEMPDAQRVKLMTYDSPAHYMVKNLARTRQRNADLAT